jgi:GMP synthase (glutamine-hydrolysing)
MPRLNVLVVDGNTRETVAAHVALGGRPTGEHYADVLRALQPDAQCTVLHPAHAGGAALPRGTSLASFDGVAWTGSALNVYRDEPAVRAQVELSRAAFEAGVPQFGSCWGLQVAAWCAPTRAGANSASRGTSS